MLHADANGWLSANPTDRNVPRPGRCLLDQPAWAPERRRVRAAGWLHRSHLSRRRGRRAAVCERADRTAGADRRVSVRLVRRGAVPAGDGARNPRCRSRPSARPRGPARAIDAGFGALEERLLDCAIGRRGFRGSEARGRCAAGAAGRRRTPRRVRRRLPSLARGGDVHRSHAPSGCPSAACIATWCAGAASRRNPCARILRMQRCLAELRAGQAPLALLALRLGYADQAHMTRELKALAGVTPREVVRRCPKSSRRSVGQQPIWGETGTERSHEVRLHHHLCRRGRSDHRLL